MSKPSYWQEAKKVLSKKDKVLKKIILNYSGILASRKDPFFSLCKSIVGQQISEGSLVVLGVCLRVVGLLGL